MAFFGLNNASGPAFSMAPLAGQLITEPMGAASALDFPWAEPWVPPSIKSNPTDIKLNATAFCFFHYKLKLNATAFDAMAIVFFYHA